MSPFIEKDKLDEGNLEGDDSKLKQNLDWDHGHEPSSPHSRPSSNRRQARERRERFDDDDHYSQHSSNRSRWDERDESQLLSGLF